MSHLYLFSWILERFVCNFFFLIFSYKLVNCIPTQLVLLQHVVFFLFNSGGSSVRAFPSIFYELLVTDVL